jgi:hypothetical protein
MKSVTPKAAAKHNLLFIKTAYSLPFYKPSYINEEVNSTEPSRKLVFPALALLPNISRKT